MLLVLVGADRALTHRRMTADGEAAQLAFQKEQKVLKKLKKLQKKASGADSTGKADMAQWVTAGFKLVAVFADDGDAAAVCVLQVPCTSSFSTASVTFVPACALFACQAAAYLEKHHQSIKACSKGI